MSNFTTPTRAEAARHKILRLLREQYAFFRKFRGCWPGSDTEVRFLRRTLARDYLYFRKAKLKVDPIP